MNKLMKKYLRKALIISMAASMIATAGFTLSENVDLTELTVHAASKETPASDFEYKTLYDGTIQIKKYKGSDASVVFPSRINGVPVSSIECEMSQPEKIVSITIPGTVKNMITDYYDQCTNLKGIYVDASNTVFHSQNGVLMLYYGSRLSYYPRGKKGAYTVPNNVKTISGFAFDYCKGLTDVTIPGNVQKIEAGAFCNCIALKSVTFSEGLEAIDDIAFCGCENLKSVTVPKSVKTIGSQALGYYANRAAMKYDILPGFVIKGAAGSAAYQYAKDNGIKFVSSSTTVAVASVKLNKTRLIMGRGETVTLNAQISPSDASNKSVAWTSSDNRIASVVNGKITAKSNGTVTITARSSNGKTAACKVTVQPPASKITLNRSTLYLGVGEKFQLTSYVQNGTASEKRAFSSSGNHICHTSGTGLLTAKKEGTAYITVKTFNGKTAKCKVVVQKPAAKVTINKTWLTLHKGQKYQLKSWVEAGTASTKRAWSSSDNSTVYTTGNGLLTAKKTGTAYITVKTYNGKSCTLKVKVID